MRYNIMFMSVDGSGFYRIPRFPGAQTGPNDPLQEWTDLISAKDFADQEQGAADAEGNPWGYRFKVLTASYPRREMYRTTSRLMRQVRR